MQPKACSIKKIKEDMTTTPPSRAGKHDGVRDGLPPEIMQILWPAIKFGGYSGASGFTVGAFAGIIRSSTTLLFAMASGIQWATLGTTYWASRGVVLHAWGKETVTVREKISASAIAGAVAGASTGGLLRGRKNVIPGALMFALFGATGQYMYNLADARNSASLGQAKSGKENSWLDSKWSPMSKLSDKDYEDMLQEKLLRVNAEIAMVDERIESLKVQERDDAAAVSKQIPSSVKKS